MTELVAWRGAHAWSLWHISEHPGTTLCGKTVESHPMWPATTVALTIRPDKVAGICQMCLARYPVLRLEA